MIRILLLGSLLLGTLSGPALAQAPTEEAPSSELAKRQGLLPVRIGLDECEGEGRDLTTAVEVVLLLSFLTILPSLLLTLTCFTRVVIVLSFVRRAMATPEMPPNAVLIGLALFLTAAVMQPVGASVYDKAVEPYLDSRIGFVEAGEIASQEVKGFLLRFTRESDVALFMEVLDAPPVEAPQELPLRIAVPAFVVSELKTAFTMGFIIYLPFLVVDIVISSILLSMGMFMLPPMIIATPIKILLFVLMDGWSLVISQLWTSLVI